MPAPPPKTLEPGCVAVGYARVDASSECRTQENLAVLSAQERARYARRRGRAGAEYLSAHALLRRTLSRYSAMDPSAWRFAPDGMGKPEVVGPGRDERFRFNLSHTQGLVACVVSRESPVGIDVESSERSRGYDALAERVLSPSEHKALKALPPSQWKARFLAHWTLKEAHLKARGTGIRSRLDALEFRLLGESGALCRPESPEHFVESSWHHLRLRPTQAHYLAVVVAGGGSPRWEIVETDG